MPLGNLDDDQKNELYNSLLSQYENVSGSANKEYGKEKELTKDAQMWNEIGRAAAKGGNAYAESVGGANFDTSGFDRIGSNLDNRLSIADKERKEAVNSYILGKKLEQDDALNKEKLNKLKYGEPMTPYQRESLDIRKKALENSNGSGTNLKDQLQMQKYKLDIDEKTKEQDQKSKSLDTEYGRAISPKHADTIREASLTKKQFDRDISELIALRKKYGAEMLNTDAVGRAKALSKDLLLSYKNLAKLGVLSKSDEDIVNAIIPSDPLQFNISSFWGQNPTLTVFTKFKEDLDKDFNDTLSTYIDGGAVKKSGGSNVEKPAAQSKPKTVIQNGFTYTLNEATGEYE